MALEITGKVTNVLPEVTGEGKNGTWMKRDFVIEYGDEYPKKVCFSTWGDKSTIVGTLAIGQEVTVSFRPESREYNDRWYQDLRAWKIEKQGGTQQPPQKTKATPPIAPTVEDENEDLPF